MKNSWCFPGFLRISSRPKKTAATTPWRWSLVDHPGWCPKDVMGLPPVVFPWNSTIQLWGYPHDYGKPQKNLPDIPTFVEVIHQLSGSELAHHRVQTMFKRLDPTVMRPNLHMMMDQPWSHRPLSQLDFTYEFAAKTPLTWWLWSSDTISSPCQFYHFLDMIYNY